jgi:hypothetical protein
LSAALAAGESDLEVYLGENPAGFEIDDVRPTRRTPPRWGR